MATTMADTYASEECSGIYVFNIGYISVNHKLEYHWQMPSQSHDVRKVITTIKIPVFIIYAILASVGIVFVIVCLIFNIVFRERK